MFIVVRHYLKAVQIIITIIIKKHSYAKFVHASSKTMEETGVKNNGKF